MPFQDSPTEQVIVWDIHRTFPAHEFFKDSGGDGQSSLYRLSKVSCLEGRGGVDRIVLFPSPKGILKN